jgi:hypothetical protein
MKTLSLLPILIIVLCAPYTKSINTIKTTNNSIFKCVIPEKVTNDYRIIGKWKLDQIDVHGCFVDPFEISNSEEDIIVFSDSIITGYRIDPKNIIKDSSIILNGKWYVRNRSLYVCYSWISKSSYFLPDTINEDWSYFKYEIENDSIMKWKAECYYYSYKRIK